MTPKEGASGEVLFWRYPIFTKTGEQVEKSQPKILSSSSGEAFYSLMKNSQQCMVCKQGTSQTSSWAMVQQTEFLVHANSYVWLAKDQPASFYSTVRIWTSVSNNLI